MKVWALFAVATALALTGCASTTKGSWACRAVEGRSCASINEIDHNLPAGDARPTSVGGLTDAARRIMAQPMTAQHPAGAPYREADPVVKVNLAPWVDGVGDYHAASQVFAVMRRGQWWQPSTPLVVQLAPVAAPAASDAPPQDSEQ